MSKARGILALAAVLAVLAGAYALVVREPETADDDRRPRVWTLQPDALTSVTIALPAEDRRAAWFRDEGGAWHAGSPDGPPVDPRRWSGGIPLLLSGPRAERLIADTARPEALAAYGLDAPAMTVDLTLSDGMNLAIEVGGDTPDASAVYVRMRGAPEVFAVDHAWRDVLRDLVRRPP